MEIIGDTNITVIGRRQAEARNKDTASRVFQQSEECFIARAELSPREFQERKESKSSKRVGQVSTFRGNDDTLYLSPLS